jgi:hypothetical protein
MTIGNAKAIDLFVEKGRRTTHSRRFSDRN